MGDTNNNSSDWRKKIVKILKSWTFYIGVLLILFGGAVDGGFDVVNKDEICNKFIKIFSQCLINGGGVFISVALVNLIYERWRDDEMERTIKTIPNLVKKRNL